MRLLVSVVCLLAVTAGAALASDPLVTYGTPGSWNGSGNDRQDY